MQLVIFVDCYFCLLLFLLLLFVLVGVKSCRLLCCPTYFLQVLQLQKLEVLARDEMLHLVSDLLESNHPELYAEFKRMVNEAVGFLIFFVIDLCCMAGYIYRYHGEYDRPYVHTVCKNGVRLLRNNTPIQNGPNSLTLPNSVDVRAHDLVFKQSMTVSNLEEKHDALN